MIFTPKYYSNFLGADFFTIASIEKEFEVEPVRIDYDRLIFFYEFENVYFNSTGSVYVGFHAVDEKGHVVQMDFRLFGEASAYDFVTSAIDYGFKLYSKGKDILVTSNSRYLLPELTTNSVKVYRKKTAHGYIYIDVGASDSYGQIYYVSIYRMKANSNRTNSAKVGSRSSNPSRKTGSKNSRRTHK